jgi:hypothetical protein
VQEEEEDKEEVSSGGDVSTSGKTRLAYICHMKFFYLLRLSDSLSLGTLPRPIITEHREKDENIAHTHTQHDSKEIVEQEQFVSLSLSFLFNLIFSGN